MMRTPLFLQHFVSIIRFVCKVKYFGIQGVINRLFPNFLINRKWKFIQKSIDNTLSAKLGFTVIADFSAPYSNGKTSRDLVIALNKARIPYQTFNLGSKSSLCNNNSLFTKKNNFKINRFTHVITNAQIPAYINTPFVKLSFHFASFDTGWSIPNDSINVVAMSDFNFDFFNLTAKHKTGLHVYKILYPFRTNTARLLPSKYIRQKFGIKNNDFVVFYNFAFCSARKNPEGVAKAFALALRDFHDAKLLFKIASEQAFPELFSALRDTIKELGISSQVVFISGYFDDNMIPSITNAIDVYCSMHRGEGFGLGMAEAMSLGKPVVATNWGGSTEFVKEGIAFPINYTLEPMQRTPWDEIAYSNVEYWAEPDIAQAAKTIRQLYYNKALRQEIGSAAKEFMAKMYSTENFRKSAIALLESSKYCSSAMQHFGYNMEASNRPKRI